MNEAPKAKTPLGQRLLDLRAKAIADGMPLLGLDEICEDFGARLGLESIAAFEEQKADEAREKLAQRDRTIKDLRDIMEEVRVRFTYLPNHEYTRAMKLYKQFMDVADRPYKSPSNS